jgi:shikimate 5-dehydrogenase
MEGLAVMVELAVWLFMTPILQNVFLLVMAEMVDGAGMLVHQGRAAAVVRHAV